MQNTNQELIKSMKGLYKELERSNFIMSTDIITKFLKFVTTNEATFFVYKHASQNFDFESVFSDAMTTGKLRLPQDDYKIVVLVTRILFDIDRGKIEYLSFLNTTFPRDKIQDSFVDFCYYIIYPYVLAYERLLSISDKVVVDAAEDIRTSKMPRQLVDLVQSNIISIYEQLAGDKSLQDNKRQEISVILEGLDIAVDIGNPMLIKSLWLGLKYALIANKAYTSQVKAIENELKNYSII